ncbi:MAG: ribosome small subunit-dependent GTPase A [Caldimonas sp.]
MLHFDFDRLHRIGLTAVLVERAGRVAGSTDDAALLRVSAIHRETVQLHDGVGEAAARLSPRLVRELEAARTQLAVGDWVLADRDPPPDRRVHARVPPVSHIARRDGDGSLHAVASNVDLALLVMGLDDDFNLRRLERYVTLAHACAVAPLVVLTKADVAAADPARRDERLASLGRRMPEGVEAIAVDATDPSSAARLTPFLVTGRTLVVLGSSGAGKSTLTNTLLGRAVQDTGAVRANDGRGMHTTTARSLHLLPGGACIIDTPGVRTLRPDIDEAGLTASFADVGALAARCRFRDCTHGGEPGCAVREGVDPDRLRNFHKLLRETRRDSLTWVERKEQLSAWKSRGKATRERMRLKRGGG